MIRKAVVEIETDYSQKEFEEWLLDLLKKVAVNPDTCRISDENQ